MTGRPPPPPPSRLRSALSLARAGARLARSTGLLGAVSPLAAVRFARDTVRRRVTGGAMVVHLHALAAPRRPALVAGGLRLDYGELDARINRLAHGLHRLGVRPGDRVALLLKNGPEYIELNAALTYLSAVAVQIGVRLKPPEVAYILRHADARALVYHAELAPVATAAVAEAGLPPPDACVVADDGSGAAPAPGALSYAALLASGSPDEPPRVDGAGRSAVMIYTSGTTGKPKGARRDLKEAGYETVFHFMSQLPLHRDDRHLVVCPLYHSAAPAMVALHLGIGACLVVLQHFDPEEVLATVERERITSMLLVPTMFHRLVELPRETLRRHDLSSLKWVLSGAAPLPTELARRVEEALGPILFNFYGATETGFVTIARPGEHTARPGTIGRLVPGNEARLLDADGRDVPDGEVGELYVRSRMLMQGYHGDEGATRAAARDGFLSVGDLARRDADGFYYLADRKHDMVISGGVNIYPFEIEQRLDEHPGVVEAAVVGVPDPEWGETLVAFVVARAGHAPTVAELQAHVAAALADYKRPRHVRFVEELPRTPTGKVLKRELRRRFLEER